MITIINNENFLESTKNAIDICKKMIDILKPIRKWEINTIFILIIGGMGFLQE